ncbi:MAG: DegV family protein, partial [Erysipelotrichaceae bacterium]|nr:DegV family protein [Erysipelotrichaceae bacterium]
MSVKIVVDSACDIPQTQGDELGIKILPLRYLLGDDEYLDGVTISNTEFYNKLENSNIFPKTSQITPFQYEQAFEEGLEECDEVLCMTMSSGVSGCFQSASIAAKDFDGKVLVFDSRHFCFSYTVLVKYAVMLRDQGLTAAEIYEKLTEGLKKVRIIAAFDTLEYLKKGGRISGTASAIGNAMGIKPIITITDGKVDVLKL